MEFRAGAASLLLEPPLGLPMMGFIRQKHGATGFGIPLEVGAIALEREDTRVLVCGVDIVGIIHPEVERLIARVADATGAAPEGILLNWSHTHLAPTGGKLPGEIQGDPGPDERASIDAFARVIQDKIVTACALAVERLEPAGVVWGQAEVDDAVNRRERTPDGFNGGSILGWNPEAPIDRQVTTLQLRRPDESVIATLVGFGCHPVTTGFDMYVYSADFPGPLRRVVRSVTGGECVFFQGGGGNVLPKFAFTDSEAEAERMGVRLALAALDSVADRFAAPVEIRIEDEASAVPISRYRRRTLEAVAPELAAASRTVSIPLLPPPPLDKVIELREQYERELDEARASGDTGRVKVAYYHAAWARKIEAGLRDGTTPREVRGSDPRRAHRRRRDRHRSRRDVHRVRHRDQAALARRAHAVRGLHERDHRVPADRRGVRVRRLRGWNGLQERRAPIALRPERRADLRRDRGPPHRGPVPPRDAVGRRARMDGRG